jgi:hypothetical protein
LLFFLVTEVSISRIVAVLLDLVGDANRKVALVYAVSSGTENGEVVPKGVQGVTEPLEQVAPFVGFGQVTIEEHRSIVATRASGVQGGDPIELEFIAMVQRDQVHGGFDTVLNRKAKLVWCGRVHLFFLLFGMIAMLSLSGIGGRVNSICREYQEKVFLFSYDFALDRYNRGGL